MPSVNTFAEKKMEQTEITKLYLVEDSDIQAEVFQGVFSERSGIEFKRFCDGNTLLHEGDFTSGPVLLLLDLFLPDMTGINLVNDLKKRHGEITFIALSSRLDIDSIRELFNIGAYDVVEKGISIIRFLGIVQGASDRARNQWNIKKARERLEGILSFLSARERDVLDSLLNGMSSKEIAFSMSISPRTVDVHRANILGKMGVSSLTALGSVFAYLGIFEPSYEEFIDSLTAGSEREGN